VALLALVLCPGSPRVEEKGPFRAPAKKGRIFALGMLMPEDVLEIGAQVGGRIIALGTDPDDPKQAINYRSRVEEGTVLARIDPTLPEANAAIARADLKLARAKLVRAGADLDVARGKADKAAVKAAEARVAEAEAFVEKTEAVLKRAELLVRYCTIRSPIKGVIIDRRVNVGQTVAADLSAPSLFLIAKDLKRLQVWANVSETDVIHVERGQPVIIRTDVYPKDTFKGKVLQVRLNATIKAREVTYMVVIDVNNTDGKLLPYMTATVEIATAKP
jgi:HlyD family secretion protein